MKHLKIYIISLMALLATGLAAQAQEVVELPLPETPSVVVKLSFRNGSITDPVGKEGLTNLTAQVLTQTGNQTHTKSQIEDILYPWAATYSAFTDKEMTTLTFEVHRDHLDRFYEIFKGVLLNPSFAESDFNRVRSNVKNFVDQVIKSSSDEDYSKMALEAQLYKGTNYEHMKWGTSEGLAAITLEDVKNHYKNFFTRNNVMIGIAGNYPKPFLAKLKADINQLPNTKPAIPAPAAPAMPNGIQVQLVAKPQSLGTAIYTGYPLSINRASKDWPAMLIVNSYLGEHRKSYSRLYQLIREQRSMNYGDYTYIEWYEAGGSNMLPTTGFPRSSNYFSIWIRPVQTAYSLKSQYPEMKDLQVGHAHFALRMALDEIDRVKNQGLTQEEFELTKQFLRSYMKLYTQTPERRLGYLLDSKFYGLNDYVGEMDKALERISLQEVNAAARKHLQTENMWVSMITDAEEAEPLKESLLQNKPSPMSYSQAVKESLPPEVLEHDKKIENKKLNVKEVTIVKPDETFVAGREK
ncbi:peptidase M16 domain-containing protein [Flammeovirgaceae bacterium 311]|nr:peptidase M16 domain-containing protein [Flammeovirgaceae bacterium 311]